MSGRADPPFEPARVRVIPTVYARTQLCNACDVCGNFGCLDSHGLCDAVDPQQTQGCFREPHHDGLHTFEVHRAHKHDEERNTPV